ncbi:MAG TPA: MarR family transcriptional regulator [Segetibacter sp.]|nr:MarR family transcriptional regulator [Segetibacter sp.]
MDIEKEIPKSYFRNHRHKALVNVLFTSNWIFERLKKFLEADDITPQQYNILRILQNSETPLSTLKIREQMMDKMSDTSRIVERLLKKKLVNKQICSYDKRLVDVTISEKGAELLQRLDKKTDELDSIISLLNDDETYTLIELLDKMREKE